MSIFGDWSFFSGSQENDDPCRKGHELSMLTILAYLLAPIAGLMMIWFKKDFSSSIRYFIDCFCLPGPFNKRCSIQDWARERLPRDTISHSKTLPGVLSTFWIDGSLMCTLINTAIPGACTNPYSHWNKPPSHAQDVAHKYLGIEPVFTKSDFCSKLSSYQESKLYSFVCQIRSGVDSIEKENALYDSITTKWIARGMGLITADQFNDAEFFIYSKLKIRNFSNIEIKITGPFSSCAKISVPKNILVKDKIVDRDELANTHGGITIHVELENERIRVGYKSKNSGIHQITISCDGENIMGSPFFVNVLQCKEKPDTCEVNNSGLHNLYSRKTSSSVNDNKKLNNVRKQNKYDKVIRNEEPNKKKVIQLDNTNIDPRSVPIENKQKMEISKFLKQLTKIDQTKVNSTSSDPNEKRNSFFIKDDYSCFQKLIDSSFRKSCRITRKSPSIFRAHYAQFSYASPICSIHIVPEDYRKLPVDEKRQKFASQKTSNIGEDADIHTSSSVSINESKEEAKKENSNGGTDIDQHTEHNNSKLSQNSKQVNDMFNVKRRKNVQEKMLFWESAFRETKNNMTSVSYEEITDKNRQIKYADSSHLVRQRTLSKSLSDLKNNSRKRINTQKSFDGNLDHCCNVSLEDRTKAYMRNLVAEDHQN